MKKTTFSELKIGDKFHFGYPIDNSGNEVVIKKTLLTLAKVRNGVANAVDTTNGGRIRIYVEPDRIVYLLFKA